METSVKDSLVLTDMRRPSLQVGETIPRLGSCYVWEEKEPANHYASIHSFLGALDWDVMGLSYFKLCLDFLKLWVLPGNLNGNKLFLLQLYVVWILYQSNRNETKPHRLYFKIYFHTVYYTRQHWYGCPCYNNHVTISSIIEALLI